MKVKQFFISLKTVFILIIIMTIILIVLAIILKHEFNNYNIVITDYVKNYNKLIKDYNSIIDQNDEFLKKNEQEKNLFLKKKKLNYISTKKLPLKIYIILMLCFVWIMNLISIVIILNRVYQNREKIIFEYDRKINKAYESGQLEGIFNLTQKLTDEDDVLAKALEWLINYEQNKTKIDGSSIFLFRIIERVKNKERLLSFKKSDEKEKSIINNLTNLLSLDQNLLKEIEKAADIYYNIFEKLESKAQLFSIGKHGEEVSFNPKNHKTFDKLIPGEKVIILEPGWQLIDKIIKMPIVGKKL